MPIKNKIKKQINDNINTPNCEISKSERKPIKAKQGKATFIIIEVSTFSASWGMIFVLVNIKPIKIRHIVNNIADIKFWLVNTSLISSILFFMIMVK